MNTGKMHSDDSSEVMLVAIEMALKKWRLALTSAQATKHREVSVDGGDYLHIQHVVKQTRERFGLSDQCRVIFCYEAGREGFHPHRVLTAAGYEVWVVDAASIEVNRRQRRAKNDPLDVRKLLGLMQRQWRAERALSIVRVPSVQQEDERQRTREREELKVERGRLRVRMQSLVFAQGYRDFPKSAPQIQRWLSQHDEQLPAQLRLRLHRELERLQLVDCQLKQLDELQRACCKERIGKDSNARVAQRLYQLKAVGERSACVLAAELFGWRRFHNRREVGALVGLTPTPYSSGQIEREQGISKAGNKRVRSLMIELAWRWLYYQPDSALSQWFFERFGHGRRSRRIGIVALARKLLISLWHYLECGVLPQGAKLKA